MNIEKVKCVKQEFQGEDNENERKIQAKTSASILKV